jgi:ATP-dependent exoDNAse (exonuclease V) alpha subunit
VEIVGVPVSIRWTADDRSHTVATIRLDDDSMVVIAGPGDINPPLRTALEFRFAGEWVDHPKHGRQFRFATYTATSPVTRHGMVVYLSKMLDQVGEMRAGKIWDRYGIAALDVLADEPDTVVADGILLPAVAKAASETLKRDRAVGRVKLEITSLLAGRGFQLAKVITESVARWGAKAGQVIRRNPYALMLAGITSAGFKRCDKLYLDLGLPPARLKRQALLAEWYFSEEGNGSTWYRAEKVIAFIERHIRNGAAGLRACRLAIRAKRLAIRRVGDERWLALAADAKDEHDAGCRVTELRSWVPPARRPTKPALSARTSTPPVGPATLLPTAISA